jgi:hypothetical protein
LKAAYIILVGINDLATANIIRIVFEIVNDSQNFALLVILYLPSLVAAKFTPTGINDPGYSKLY